MQRRSPGRTGTPKVISLSVAHLGADTGVFAAPEGAATAAAVPIMLERGMISEDDEVVLFNTGSGLKSVGMSPID